MRILHLATDAWGGHGGIALYNRELITAMAAYPACEEIVVVPRIISGDVGTLPDKVRMVPAAARGKVAYAVTLARTLARSAPFDLVICAHLNLMPYALLTRARPLLMIYGIEAWAPKHVRLLHRLRAVVSISDITLSRFRDWAHVEAPTFLLPNAIDLAQYGIRAKNDALLDRYGLRGKRVLLTVGRVVASERYKGFDEVIEVLPELVKTHPDLAYVVAGHGTDMDRLRKKAAALGVGDRVVFTGFFAEEEKADLYNLADVYVMPSRGEGFGFVLLEALASGVPVIGSRHDGGREALRDGLLGTLVDPTNPAELRLAIADALARGKRRIPAGLEFFEYARFVRQTHAILDAVVTA